MSDVRLKGPYGESLDRDFEQRWVEDRLKRIRSYYDLGDGERVETHARLLNEAFTTRCIPSEAWDGAEW